MCVAADASKLFCMAHIAYIKSFLYHLNFHFKYQTLYTCKLDRLSWRKSTQVRESAFFSRTWAKLTQNELFSFSKSEHFFRVNLHYVCRYCELCWRILLTFLFNVCLQEIFLAFRSCFSTTSLSSFPSFPWFNNVNELLSTSFYY